MLIAVTDLRTLLGKLPRLTKAQEKAAHQLCNTPSFPPFVLFAVVPQSHWSFTINFCVIGRKARGKETTRKTET
jgi:hypothetical protein